ncbi:unnamed protein product [Caenorhabditis bovis]|uniref:Uncharacterized protein n=1 Tax=Caenorhabditis bovis TaxID=2654633 RepID=A0A8S1EPI5_9PELO|nr:unnamed protein product [Caenorhabditis bovis]
MNRGDNYEHDGKKSEYRNELIPKTEALGHTWVDHPDCPYMGGPLNLPGYLYVPIQNKYYKYSPNMFGMNFQIPQEFYPKVHVAPQRSPAFNAQRRHRPVFKIVDDSMLGRGNPLRDECELLEKQVANCPSEPSFSIRTPVEVTSRVLGCEFLTFTEDGTKIIGGFGAGHTEDTKSVREYSVIYVYDVNYDDYYAKEEAARKDANKDPMHTGFNTMGLTMSIAENLENSLHEAPIPDNSIWKFREFLVDQTLAQIDSEVVTLLTVTTSDRMDPYGIVMSTVRVTMMPVQPISDPHSWDQLCAPIYNRVWRNSGPIWSIGWNSPKMLYGFGMESNFMFQDFLTDRTFFLSSRGKNVLSHAYSEDGELVYMGLRGDDLIRSDLREKRGHITGHLRGSKSTVNVKVLAETHPECVLTEMFGGNMKLWDFRWPKRALMTFDGHVNTHHRLPLYIDPAENFVFASGSDGDIRGWSLKTGEMLCSVTTPRPDYEGKAYFPQILYSNRWGGRYGNSGLAVAVGDTIRIHQLEL